MLEIAILHQFLTFGHHLREMVASEVPKLQVHTSVWHMALCRERAPSRPQNSHFTARLRDRHARSPQSVLRHRRKLHFAVHVCFRSARLAQTVAQGQTELAFHHAFGHPTRTISEKGGVSMDEDWLPLPPKEGSLEER